MSSSTRGLGGLDGPNAKKSERKEAEGSTETSTPDPVRPEAKNDEITIKKTYKSLKNLTSAFKKWSRDSSNRKSIRCL